LADKNGNGEKTVQGPTGPRPTTSVEVSAFKGLVIVQMQEPVQWLGMPPQVARDFAEKIIKTSVIAETQEVKA
jgi:hypothetical protein